MKSLTHPNVHSGLSLCSVERGKNVNGEKRHVFPRQNPILRLWNLVDTHPRAKRTMAEQLGNRNEFKACFQECLWGCHREMDRVKGPSEERHLTADSWIHLVETEDLPQTHMYRCELTSSYQNTWYKRLRAWMVEGQEGWRTRNSEECPPRQPHIGQDSTKRPLKRLDQD